MDSSYPIVQTMLQNAAKYRLTLESAENCLIAHVNPITGRHLITAEQADSLKAILATVRSDHPDASDRELVNHFALQAIPYLRSTSSSTTSEAAMQEVWTERDAHYATHTKIKFQPHGTPNEERSGNPRNRSWATNTRTVTAQGAARTLYTEFEKFKTTHSFTYEAIGAACIGKLTQRPQSAAVVGNAVSTLGHGRGVASIFRYIATEPDAFFDALERSAAANGKPATISAEERSALVGSVEAALAQHRESNGR